MSMIKPPPGVISKKRQSQISNLKWLADKKGHTTRPPPGTNPQGGCIHTGTHSFTHACMV